MSIPSSTSAPINTAHSYFLRGSPDPALPPTALLFRGVNLSSTSKYPALPPRDPKPTKGRTRRERDERRNHEKGLQTWMGEEAGFWDEAEAGGREGWFAGRPFDLELADVHLRRLRAWGFTTIRYVIPWEALEHAGPGQYDEAFIDYTIAVLQKCKDHDLRVFMSAHEDSFSRFCSGSGAPYWVLLAMGMNPRRLHQTAAAMLHNQWLKDGYGGLEGREAAANGETGEWPDMIWVTNCDRLSGRHAYTMFFASETFAPKCKIDGKPAGAWLRDHWNNAYGYLADRLSQVGGLLDETVIGWDSMNEPSPGFVGLESIDSMPEDQEYRKGPSPTPIQALRLGNGQSVDGIEYDDFTSTGLKKKGTVRITPPNGSGVWLTRQESEEAQARFGYKWDAEWNFWEADGSGGCPWAGHGVWDPATGKSIHAAYFQKAKGSKVDFIRDYWRPWYESYIDRIRQSHKLAISFINPPIFQEPPDLSEDVKRGRMALSCHFYDGLTMLGKRRHVFNANSVKLQRGMVNMFQALKFGRKQIRDTMHEQLAELKGDSEKPSGMAGDEGRAAYPTIIGEIGVPFDMKKDDSLFGLAKGKSSARDYTEPAKAMDEVLSGCDGENALSYTVWCYEPLNDHKNGDGWQGEDLSLFSYDDIDGEDDLLADDPPDLKTLIRLGARGIDAWCRPYPAEVCGQIQHFRFDMATSEFELRISRVSFADSALWQAETKNRGIAEQDVTGGPVTALIYVPFVHYLHSGLSDKSGQKRLVGQPGEGLNEWEKGKGPAVVDIEIQELSEGKVEVTGQWMKWTYQAPKAKSGDLHLKFRKWKA